MRDDFSIRIKEVLAKRVNYCCSNPSCRRSTCGPHVNPTKTVNVGVAAHLTAASMGGPRYDVSLSAQQRKSIENGIWLCQKCAKLIDNDAERYTLEVLQDWKRLAEETAIRQLESNEGNRQSIVHAHASYIPIPNIYGLAYDEARDRLIESGWQPFTRHWSYIDDIDIRYGNGSVFWEKGYHEIESSSGTGHGFCSFEFIDVYGNQLWVVTEGEEIPEEDIRASVVRWFFKRES